MSLVGNFERLILIVVLRELLDDLGVHAVERIEQCGYLSVQARAFGDRFLKRTNVGFQPL